MSLRLFHLALGLGVGITSLHGQAGATHLGKKLPPSQGQEAVLVPDDVTVIEESSLEFSASTASGLFDPGGERADGMRFYFFKLKPKEKMAVKMTAERANRIGMSVPTPSKRDGMYSEYMRLSRMVRALLSTQFSITNVTKEPYSVKVLVYGRCNFPYRMDITRTMEESVP